MSFLCLPTYAVITIIAVVLVQYAFALFCLLKLAFLDISKKEYVLWNLFILLVFFIGDIAFLIYWFKVKDKKTIPPYTPPQAQSDENAEAPDNADGKAEQAEEVENTETTADENTEKAEESKEPPAEDNGDTEQK